MSALRKIRKTPARNIKKTKRKKRDYLDDLDNPSLELTRRLALILLRMVRHLECVSAYIDVSPIDFEHEISQLGDNLQCVNSCGNNVVKETMATYCSEYCGQIAGTIRYARRGMAGKREADKEFQIGLGMRLDPLSNGGYPAKERHLSKEIREAIFKQDNYTCRICLKHPAQQIDHIAGSSNNLSNLQAVCIHCHNQKTFSNRKQATAKEQKHLQELYENIALRVAAHSPSMACDDHMHWEKAEPKIRFARISRILELQIAQQGITEECIADFFDETYGRSGVDCKISKARQELTCNSCNNPISKGTVYAFRRAHRSYKACLDCLIDYKDGGWQDTDGYVAHTMTKSD